MHMIVHIQYCIYSNKLRGKIKYFSHGPQIIIILLLEIVILLEKINNTCGTQRII